MTAVTEALRHLLNIRQAKNEPPLECLQHFKEKRDAFKSHMGGSAVLTGFVRQLPECLKCQDTDLKTSDEQKTEMREEAFEKWMAHPFLS